MNIRALLPCPLCGHQMRFIAERVAGTGHAAQHPGDDCVLSQMVIFEPSFAAWNRRHFALSGEVKDLVERALFLASAQDDAHSVVIAELADHLAALSADNAAKDTEIARLTAQVAEMGEALIAADELEEAGHLVLVGLNARIDAAPSTSKPVFNGIADLHDALGHFRRARSARRAG